MAFKLNWVNNIETWRHCCNMDLETSDGSTDDGGLLCFMYPKNYFGTVFPNNLSHLKRLPVPVFPYPVTLTFPFFKGDKSEEYLSASLKLN